jgi:hypothetical protein
MDDTPTPNTYENCEQCGSPVDHAQRYCVVCGSRRKHVPDPALKYMASSGARTRAGNKPAAQSGRSRRSAGLGTAIVIAMIPLAVALGLLIGHNGNSSDAKVLAALRARPASVVNVTAGGGGTESASTSGSSSSSGKSKHKKSSKSGDNSGKVLNKTKYGSFNSVASIKPPTQQQQAQGAQVVKHDESDTNQSYVNQQKNLPNVIPVP